MVQLLSDHDTFIITLLATKLATKPGLSKRTISYHKLEDINTDHMITSLNLDSLEDIVFSFNNNLQKALDHNAKLKGKNHHV